MRSSSASLGHELGRLSNLNFPAPLLAWLRTEELFKSLNDEGVTIIMITHDANVASHAKKILHIIDGEIIENKQGGAAWSLL